MKRTTNKPLDNQVEHLTCGITDEREAVIASANRRLRESGYPTLRGITCDFDGEQMTLWGRVPSFYQKQVAQTLVQQIAQVQRVINELNVMPRHGYSQ